MPDLHELLDRRASQYAPRPDLYERVLDRRHRRDRSRRIASAVVAVLVAGVAIAAVLRGFSSTTVPATPRPSVTRTNGEVLSFTGSSGGTGDLVAVTPGTHEEHILVEDLELVYSASWSADGRWVAYETSTHEGGRGLWVMGPSGEPRLVATDASMWMWSSTGAQLAVIRQTSTTVGSPYYSGATLMTIDAVTDETTDVGSIPYHFGHDAGGPRWSPDGTRFVFGVRGGAIYSIDAQSGALSLLAQLPGEHLDSVDQLVWSPDGAHIAVMNDGDPGGLYIMAADGSDVRMILEGYSGTDVAWSPDGRRLAYEDDSGAIWVATTNGSAQTKIGNPLHDSGAGVLLDHADLVWSPDGSQIAYRDIGYRAGGELVTASAFPASGLGDAKALDELTYRSWDGGSYACAC